MTVHTEMARVLESAQRAEVREASWTPRASAASSPHVSPLRQRAPAIISPLLVANSTFNAALTQQAKDEAARVAPVRFNVVKGQIVVKQGELIDDLLYERLATQPDHAAPIWPSWAAGSCWRCSWSALLGWVWRFRPEFWHRNNALVLMGLVLLVTLLLRLTADRSVLPYFVPTAAAVLLLTVLLDSSVAW